MREMIAITAVTVEQICCYSLYLYLDGFKQQDKTSVSKLGSVFGKLQLQWMEIEVTRYKSERI